MEEDKPFASFNEFKRLVVDKLKSNIASFVVQKPSLEVKCEVFKQKILAHVGILRAFGDLFGISLKRVEDIFHSANVDMFDPTTFRGFFFQK